MYCAEVFVGAVQITGIPDRGPGRWNYVVEDATIYVHNLSYNKQIGLHIKVNGSWVDLNALYSKSLLTGGGNTIEVWKYSSSLAFMSEDLTRPLKTFQFAVFYHNLDSATSYWDNNNGQDYFVAAVPG